MLEITHESYQVRYSPETATVICAGSFRLRGEEYAPIAGLLNEAADAAHPTLTLDVSGLQFLNSSGINTLSRFILRVRNQSASRVKVKGNSAYPWQNKSLKNLEKLMPGLTLELD